MNKFLDVDDESLEVVGNSRIPEPIEKLEAAESFQIPDRNWELIIKLYNNHSRTRFPLQPVDCKILVEYAKRDIPEQYVLEGMGFSQQKYTSIVTKVAKMEEEIEDILKKPQLTEEDQIDFQKLKSNPWRILFSDIGRAKGLANILNWERFNEQANLSENMNLVRMKNKFKEFEQKNQGGTEMNVQINLGGDFLQKLAG